MPRSKCCYRYTGYERQIISVRRRGRGSTSKIVVVPPRAALSLRIHMNAMMICVGVAHAQYTVYIIFPWILILFSLFQCFATGENSHNVGIVNTKSKQQMIWITIHAVCVMKLFSYIWTTATDRQILHH